MQPLGHGWRRNSLQVKKLAKLPDHWPKMRSFVMRFSRSPFASSRKVWAGKRHR